MVEELRSGFGEASSAMVLRMLESGEHVRFCSKLIGFVIGISVSSM